MPVPTGRPAPRLPPDDDRSTKADKAREAFAAYVIALYHPWDLTLRAPPIELTYASLQKWTQRLNKGHSIVERMRLRWIQVLASSLVMPQEDIKLGAALRSRGVRPWTQLEIEIERRGAAKSRDVVPDPREAAADALIDALSLKYALSQGLLHPSS